MSKTTPHGCAVTVTAPTGSYRVDVRIIGDLDTTAVPLLSEAVVRVSAGAPRSVFIDVAGVTAEGSLLSDFLRQVHDRLPRSSSLVVCRPGPATRLALAATGVMQLVVVCGDRLG